jgi:hypothetical protein
MKPRDVATIAFRLLALWLVLSALSGLVELLATWKLVAAQMMGMLSGMNNAPTRGELLWLSAGAMLSRGLVGLIAWWVAPWLARVTCPSEQDVSLTLRSRELFAAASFLVGLCLVAVSVPGLALVVFLASRPGVPMYPEAQPQTPVLLTQFALGIACLRGRWLIKWASSEPESNPRVERAGAVQPPADET